MQKSGSILVQFRMGELAGEVVVGFYCLDEIPHGTCQAVAFAALDPRDLAYGYDLDGDCSAAVADPLDAQLVDAWILGVKEPGCLDPFWVGDIGHPEWEAVGVVSVEHNTTNYDKSLALRALNTHKHFCRVLCLLSRHVPDMQGCYLFFTGKYTSPAEKIDK